MSEEGEFNPTIPGNPDLSNSESKDIGQNTDDNAGIAPTGQEKNTSKWMAVNDGAEKYRG